MRLILPALLIATLTLSACAAVRDSRVNPINWFGNSRSGPVQPDPRAATNPLIPETRRAGLFSSLREQTELYVGTPIDQVTDLVIERVPGGAIVRATGIASEDRVYDVRLTTESDENVPVDGTLTYQLRAVHSDRPTRRLSQRVRTVTAARRLTDQELAEIRVIRVEGLRNAQTTTRR
ncbi:hypothetical protein GCM10007385_11890 [Tateyamaria omphalii]|uniref:hypothetical protein n=1 Tax=Tateyamaria omphalii TaxID=299262 RepID=UPI00167C0305|nr:hypothetical protein [Tateyamaria omphalii]GGX46004.1 hypothetical protein GCM10007385_11890 [Tateyamaria omphalii]